MHGFDIVTICGCGSGGGIPLEYLAPIIAACAALLLAMPLVALGIRSIPAAISPGLHPEVLPVRRPRSVGVLFLLATATVLVGLLSFLR